MVLTEGLVKKKRKVLGWVAAVVRNKANPCYKLPHSGINSSSSSSVFSPKAGFGRNQSPVTRPVWLWHTAF